MKEMQVYSGVPEYINNTARDKSSRGKKCVGK